MKKRAEIQVSVCCLAFSSALFAEQLMQTDKSWDGNDFHYPEGDPQVTSIYLNLSAGEQTAWHCHPVPTMGYVLSGSLEVETIGGERIRLEQGDSVVEVMRTLHRGHGLEDGVKIVVFYAGATDIPNTVLRSDPASAAHCAGEPPAP